MNLGQLISAQAVQDGAFFERAVKRRSTCPPMGVVNHRIKSKKDDEEEGGVVAAVPKRHGGDRSGVSDAVRRALLSAPPEGFALAEVVGKVGVRFSSDKVRGGLQVLMRHQHVIAEGRRRCRRYQLTDRGRAAVVVVEPAT